ncbi:Ppx/GppA phosphatase family protein [Corynebacterium liangguodongii]|uniref:Exopolyphosphatase n=1 Tax=Corynebacterium liangguodongii TaxID=2079535 RepID=A0A2S0WF92_9CORY|nr:Ppx/GppA phosphatase family protein [Corynebacterium liangguodongii]AWB84438.1 exopolyphosphatase [Corynebacterium liangguodongii]PWB99927.1 Ppx/GppA family phosphatase [Corynebacterium liangguodongii]
MTRTVAAVDCGTNSIRLLIVREGNDGTRAEIARRNEIVRLGQGVDKNGMLSPEAIERTRAALAAYVEEMRASGVERVRMVATSATRDAANREDFFSMTAQLLGQIEPGARAEVISGEEEAALSYAGATADIDPARGPFCVIDLGGGSTEFVTDAAAISTQMGCVRLTERFLRSDPPAREEDAAARAYVRGLLGSAHEAIDFARPRTLVGCAGTFTTLSALVQGLEEYDPMKIHCSELSFAQVRETTARLRELTSEQRAAIPAISAGREDVIASGALVVEEIMEATERLGGCSSFVISEKDLLDGIVTALL